MDRAETGIKGFDKLIQGGFPRQFNVLFVGLPGTGKTIFSLQYLYNGAMNGEPGVYVSLDTIGDKVYEQGLQFGWDLKSLENENKLSVIKVPLNREKIRIFDMIQTAVDRIKAKRLVFDSLAAFAINIDQFAIPLAFDDEIDRILGRSKPFSDSIMYEGNSEKRITYLTLNKLSDLGTTNIIVTDSVAEGSDSSVDGVSEYICDGVVRLHAIEGEESFNTLNISKMRLTAVNRGIYNFSIGSKGIELKESV